MKKWKGWKKGDLIAVVAPGSGVPQANLNSALEILSDWGLKISINEPLFNGHPYLAHDDRKRSQDLGAALKNPKIHGIWCVRGGYGALRLIPDLLKIKSPKVSKLLIGYSDISSIHLLLNQNWRWISCHGPLLESLVERKYSEEEVNQLRAVLFGEVHSVKYEIVADNSIAKKQKAKILAGQLVGGNLMTYVSHMGTSLSPHLAGRILFLEETGERGYRLDRLLSQLLQNKGKGYPKAVVLGQFLGGQEKSGENFVGQALDLFRAELERLKIPLYSGLPCGHGHTNCPLFLGASAEIQQGNLSQWTGVQT